MRTRLHLIGVFTVAVLLGCSSFNFNQSVSVTHMRYDAKGDPIVDSKTTIELAPGEKAELVTGPVKKRDDTKPELTLCPAFRLPALGKVPELPYKEILEAGPNNPARVDEIERKHIEELRTYIIRSRAAIMRSHAAYLRECREYVQKESP